MKNAITRFLQSVGVSLAALVFIVSIAYAYQNPVINQTTGGGSVVVTPNLQQVTDAGNTASNNLIITSTATSTFAGAVSSTRFIGNMGSQTLPSFTFTGHTNSGLYDNGAGAIDFTSLGSQSFLIENTDAKTLHVLPFTDNIYSFGNSALRYLNGWFNGIVTSTQFIASAGSVTAPGYAFAAHQNTGIFDFSGQMRVAVQGVNAAVFESTGMDTLNLLPLTNAASDIGSPSLVYRSGWFGQVNASTTGGSSLPALVVTGTGMFTGQTGGNFLICNNNCSALAKGMISVNQATGLMTIGGDGGSTDLNLEARGAGVLVMTGTDLSPNSGKGTGVVSLGLPSLAYKNVYATGSEISLTGLAANDITDKFVCISATGTLRTETANCTVSSVRFKEHIDSLSSKELLAETLKLRSVQFDYTKENGGRGTLGTPTDQGFIAEEVAMIDPYLVAWEVATPEDLAKVKKLYPQVPIEKNGVWYIPHTVAYDKLSVLFAGAIQAEDERITALEKRLDANVK